MFERFHFSELFKLFIQCSFLFLSDTIVNEKFIFLINFVRLQKRCSISHFNCFAFWDWFQDPNKAIKVLKFWPGNFLFLSAEGKNSSDGGQSFLRHCSGFTIRLHLFSCQWRGKFCTQSAWEMNIYRSIPLNQMISWLRRKLKLGIMIQNLPGN